MHKTRVAALAALMLSGCTLLTGLRARVGPTLDTEGAVGIEAGLGLTWGAGEDGKEAKGSPLETAMFATDLNGGVNGAILFEYLHVPWLATVGPGIRRVPGDESESTNFGDLIAIEFGGARVILFGDADDSLTLGGVGARCAWVVARGYMSCGVDLTFALLTFHEVKLPH